MPLTTELQQHLQAICEADPARLQRVDLDNAFTDYAGVFTRMRVLCWRLLEGDLSLVPGSGSAIIWFARLYRVNRHNAVVHQHRADALGTFEALVAAAGGRAGTSDIILQQAASAIFAPQPTGYSEGTDPPAIQPQLVEVIRSAKE